MPLDDTQAPPDASAPPDKSDSTDAVGRVLGMRKTLKADRDVADALEPGALAPPKLEPAPPMETPTDPIKAFGQPAMWLAMFGSLLTRQHLTSAVTSAASVMHATQALDAEAAKNHYEAWKVANKNAIDLAKYQQSAYKAAIARMAADARGAAAGVGALAAAFKDEAMMHVYQTQGIDGVARFLKGRGKQIDAMGSGADAWVGKNGERVAALQAAKDKADAEDERRKGAGQPPMTTRERRAFMLPVFQAELHHPKGESVSQQRVDNATSVVEALSSGKTVSVGGITYEPSDYEALMKLSGTDIMTGNIPPKLKTLQAIVNRASSGTPTIGAAAPAADKDTPPPATPPPTVPAPAQRVMGHTYQTPRGPMIWTGTGWAPPVSPAPTQPATELPAGPG